MSRRELNRATLARQLLLGVTRAIEEHHVVRALLMRRADIAGLVGPLQPDVEARRLAFGVRAFRPLVEILPAGFWDFRGSPRYVLAESWLPGSPAGEEEGRGPAGAATPRRVRAGGMHRPCWWTGSSPPAQSWCRATTAPSSTEWPLRALSASQWEEVVVEGQRLIGFLAPDSRAEVRLGPHAGSTGPSG